MLLGILTNSDENVDIFEGANVELYSCSFIADIEKASLYWAAKSL
jgi:hypothetical protein